MNENNGKRNSQSPSTPLVSFIITTYNIPVQLLEACLQSILALSLSRQQREIVLVDDGSAVSPIDQLGSHRDEILYVRQANQGLSAARNTGLAIASGRYIQFVDGDDTLIPAAYEHCLDIVRYHNPDVVMFSPTSEEATAVSFSIDGPVTGCSFMRNNNIRATACGYVFRKGILGGLRFTPGILHEDEDFTPQLFLRADRFFTTDARAYYHRQRPGSIITSHDTTVAKKGLDDTEWIIGHLQSLVDTLPEEAKAALRRRIAQLTMDLLYNILQQTSDNSALEATIDRLRKRGLFPLPDMAYTRKYSLFRMAINNKLARKVLPKIVQA